MGSDDRGTFGRLRGSAGSPRPRALALRYLTAATVLASVIVLVGGFSAQAGSNPILLFSVDIGGCFSGHGANPHETVAVTWKGKDGHLKLSAHVTADGSGYWYPPDGACDTNTVDVGDRIKAKTPGMSRTFTVPKLTVAFDRDANSVHGQAPGVSAVTLVVSDSELVKEPTEECQTTVAVQLDGRYHTIVASLGGTGTCDPGYDPTGGDRVIATATTPDNDLIQRAAQAPYAWFGINEAYVSGAVGDLSSADLHLRSAGGTPLAKAHASGDGRGDFETRLRNTGGALVKTKAGERVDGDWAGPVSFKLPAITISSQSDGSFRGNCMPHANYRLSASGGSIIAFEVGVTDGQGRTEMAPPGTASHGDRLQVICARPSGDLISKSTIFH